MKDAAGNMFMCTLYLGPDPVYAQWYCMTPMIRDVEDNTNFDPLIAVVSGDQSDSCADVFSTNGVWKCGNTCCVFS